MARDKKLVIGAINITMHPHSPEKYLELFQITYQLRYSVNIFGDQHGLLAGCFKLVRDQKEPGPITGDIFKYTSIDKTAQWFNIDTNDFATEDDVGVIYIPENLKPNSARFSYIFFPKEHLIFYEGYYDGNSFGPKNAERFFNRIFSHQSIIDKFGNISVTHIPAINKLSEALKIPVKERIEMVIKRPNPDSHAEAERKVMERMKARNVGIYEQKYKASRGESITMDEELETMAYISSKNGHFYIKGKDANSKPQEYSTEKHPFVTTEYYNPSIESSFELFTTMAESLKTVVTGWFRR